MTRLFLEQCLKNLKQLDSSQWWIHEDVLLDVLDVEHEYDTIDEKKECVYMLIKLLKRGKLSTKVDGFDMTLNSERLSNIEDQSIDNSFDFWMQECRPKGSNKQVKWFKKGKSISPLKYQLSLLNFAIGAQINNKYPSNEDKERKQHTYQGWYHGDKLDSISYKNNSLKQVIKAFPEAFQSTHDKSSLLKQCIFYSNVIFLAFLL